MGTNLLIVLPGSHHAGRRARRLRLAADADLGRPARRSRREVPDGALRGARSCAPTRSSCREDQNWTTQRQRHHARVLRDPQLADGARLGASPTPTSRAAPRSSCSAQTVVDKLFGAERRPGRPDRCASRTSPSRSSACWRRRASRRWARTTTTPSSSRCTTFQTKIQGGLQQVSSPARSSSAPTSHGRDRRGAEQQITALLRDRHHIGSRAPTTTSRSAT